MTEAEWMACAPEDIPRMVSFLQERKNGRKLLLFVCGCCRRLWPLLEDPRSKNAVEKAERDADGPDVEAISPSARPPAWEAYYDLFTSRATGWEANVTLQARRSAAYATYALESQWHGSVAHHASVAAKYWARLQRMAGRPAAKAERVACLRLLRDVAGNPFRPTVLDRGWLTSTVLALARGVYESRDFGAMPILADALQDADCEDQDILDHCRSHTPHTRGCWVVDGLLGRD